MNLTCEERGALLLIVVQDARIDASVAIQFKDQLRAFTTGAPPRIIIDLARVDFIDSSGLGAIVASMKQLSDNQTLELASLSPNVSKVFRLTRMDSVFRIHGTATDATEDANGA